MALYSHLLMLLTHQELVRNKSNGSHRVFNLVYSLDENTVDFKIEKIGDEYVLHLWEGSNDYTKHGKLTLQEDLKLEYCFLIHV